MEGFILLVAIHFIADFPFQPEFLALNKGKSWELLFYHCAVYTGAFVAFGKVSMVMALIILVSHLIIDPLKARYKIIKPIWVDQLLHISTLYLCHIYGI